MAEKVKSISTYNIDNDQGSWSDPVPLGADIENIDITNQVTDPTVSSSVINDLLANEVTISEGDTGATAWTKFNRVRKVLHNLLTSLNNTINTISTEFNSLKTSLTSKKIDFSSGTLLNDSATVKSGDIIVGGNIVTGSGTAYFPIAVPPLATQMSYNFSNNTGNFGLSFGDSGAPNFYPTWVKCRNNYQYQGKPVFNISFNPKTRLALIEININAFINGAQVTFADTFQNARSLQLTWSGSITFS